MSNYYQAPSMNAKAHAIEDEYAVDKHGAVVAIHIYNGGESGATPMADLAFAFGGSKSEIRWDVLSEREKYQSGITSYTIVYDDRFRDRSFDSWVKPVA